MKVAIPIGKPSGRIGLRLGRLPRRRLVLLLVAALISIAAGYLGYQRVTAGSQAAPAVQTAPARKGSLVSTVSATGSVVATRQAKLGFSASGSASGKLIELNVNFGDTVKTGQVLARLDPVPFQVTVDKSQSTLNIVRSDLEELTKGATADEVAAARASYEAAVAKHDAVVAGASAADMAAAEASADQARANLELAQLKLDQLKNNTYTQADWTSAQASVDQATSSLKNAQAKLDEVKKGSTQAEIATQQAAVNQARQALTSAEDKYEMAKGDNLASSGYSSVSAAQQAYDTAKANYDAAVQKLNDLMAGPLATELQSAQTSVDQAQANLKTAQAKLDQMKQGPQATDLASAQNSVEQAKATLASAQAKLDQLRQGPTDADLKAAKSSLASARTDLASKTGPPKSSALLKAQEAVKQAQVSLDQARNDLKNATLVAPFDGIVSAVSGNVGEMVGSATVVTLVDPKSVRIDATVDESDVARIVAGQPVSVSFDALPDQRMQGKVVAVAPAGTTQQGVVSYLVSVGIEALNRTLPAGMSASLTIETERKDNVLLVPNRAVRTAGKAKTVEVMSGGKSETRTVQTGASNDQMIEIVSGVKGGEQVVIPSTTTRSSTNIGGAGMGVPGIGGPPPR
ncbi:MAG: efflux RND transporter periplasmic adaptor subunit [Chloroflexota bacterium]